MTFDDKVILITGSGKGLGRIIAKRFAARGGVVIVHCFHSLSDAKATVDEINAQGGRADWLRASVAKKEQVESLFREIRNRYGRLDVLVNNAASGALVPLSGVTEEVLDRSFNTNLKGSFWCSVLAAQLMKQSGGGSIVNLSTLGGGQLVMENYLGCGPAKAAVESLTRYLAAEFGCHNIRVNTAAAGMIESEVANAFPNSEKMHERIRSATPMGRLGKPEEFADLILFLASEQARWITGQTIVADGGLSCGRFLLSPQNSLSAIELSLPSDLIDLNTIKAVATDTELPASNFSPRAGIVDAHTTASTGQSLASSDNDNDQSRDTHEIAIVGMGLVVPGANDVDEFWQVLNSDANAFVKVPADRWNNAAFHSSDRSAIDKTYQEKAGFITNFKPVDNGIESIRQSVETASGVEVEFTTKWLRSALRQAIAGVNIAGEEVHYLLGYTADGSQHLEESMVVSGFLERLHGTLADHGVEDSERKAILDAVEGELLAAYPRSECADRALPHQVCLESMRGILPANTEVQVIDTACSSSLYSIDIGMKRLRLNPDATAICGGAFSLGPRGSILFAKLNGLSVRGEVRSLDESADGVLFADGAAVVVLKSVARAQRDGDTILGIVESLGCSSDGAGKAIYAPNSNGQQIAIQRAFAKSRMQKSDVDWVIAHATGTPAGDLAEFTSLRREYDIPKTVYVTSNKSTVGHTGWAAGVVSVIEAIMAMRHQQIPKQNRFVRPPKDFEIEKTQLRIPDRPIPWIRTDRPRCVAISGFGFGGTNAHLLLREPSNLSAANDKPRRTPNRERVAIVGWSTHVPGLETQAEKEAWLRHPTTSIPVSFGADYPKPEFKKVRMPPKMIRTLDRCQLMVLECSHQLREQLGPVWDEQKDQTGVFLAHLGPTRNASLYSTKCYIDDTHSRLDQAGLFADKTLATAWQSVVEQLKSVLPDANEDSFPGSMPNVIPARVANFFDLHGPNMTIDTGKDSTLSAIDTAMLYLMDGDITLALVGSLHGNTAPEMQMVYDYLGERRGAVSEGAFFMAIATESFARENNLPMLATIDVAVGENSNTTDSILSQQSYLGADRARLILHGMLNSKHLDLAFMTQSRGAKCLKVSPLVSRHAASSEETYSLPAAFAGEHVVTNHPNSVARYAVNLRAQNSPVVRDPWEFFPNRCLVVTDNVDLLPPLPDSIQVIGLQGSNPDATVLDDLDASSVQRAIAQLPDDIKHLRVLVDMNEHLPYQNGNANFALRGTSTLAKLHDLVFLTLKSLAPTLQDDQSTWITLVLNAWNGKQPHWASGLFTGFQKSAALEIRPCSTFCLLTSSREWANAISEATEESQRERGLPVVFVHDGVRSEVTICENDTLSIESRAVEVANRAPRVIPANSIWVIAGGARGITGEILKGVAQAFRPVIYVLGSNPLHAHPKWVFDDDDETFTARKAAFIKEEMAKLDGRTVGQVAKSFERLANARLARKNLDQIELFAGRGRVHYLHCDLTDNASTLEAIASVYRVHKKVDFVVFTAGLNRSTPMVAKSLDEFRGIRDVKWTGYGNLKRAFANRLPQYWINFGSLLGLTGQIGECDYASGNDMLSLAALSNRDDLATETTIGWTLWGETGMGANGLTKDYFEKSGTYSSMPTQEGIYHFVRELFRGGSNVSMVHIGDAEKRAIAELIPTFTSRMVGQPTDEHEISATEKTHHEGNLGDDSLPAPLNEFYLTELVTKDESSYVFTRLFDDATDQFLVHHAVNGAPTLPGTFVTEIAAEVVHAIAPDLFPTMMEDIHFHRFLKLAPVAESNRKRIETTVLERGDEHIVVKVRVLSDVVTASGVVLVKDQLHFEATVTGSAAYPAAPTWLPWEDEGIPTADPYHMEGVPVHLTQLFKTTVDTRCHHEGKSGRFHLDLGRYAETFKRFRAPCLMMDGLARLGVLTSDASHGYPLAAPLSIRRIDFYEPGNDQQILERHQDVHLCCASNDMAFHEGSSNRFVATRADGRMILQIKDIRAKVMGYFDPSTGRYYHDSIASSHSSN